MPIIKLKSADEEIFDADLEIVKCSGTIMKMLKEDENAIVPLPEVNSTILRKVLIWANHHKDDPQPTEYAKGMKIPTEDITPWDAKFVDIHQGTLIDLTNAAHYLDIKALVYLGCLTLANMIKGKSAKQMRKIFNLRPE